MTLDKHQIDGLSPISSKILPAEVNPTPKPITKPNNSIIGNLLGFVPQ